MTRRKHVFVGLAAASVLGAISVAPISGSALDERSHHAAASPPATVAIPVGRVVPKGQAARLVLRSLVRGVVVVRSRGRSGTLRVRLAARRPVVIDVTRLLTGKAPRTLLISAPSSMRLVVKGPARPRLRFVPVDVRPPSTPTALRLLSASRTEMAIAWNPATDDGVVTAYLVKAGTAPAKRLTATQATLSPLDCGETYAVSVSAVDKTGKVGRPATANLATAGCPVVAAVGDIACDPASPNFVGGEGIAGVACRQKYVAASIRALNPEIFLALGDLQYSSATASRLAGSFSPAFGDLLPRMRVAQGNHDFESEVGSAPTSLATSYLSYFGAAAGGTLAQSRYSFDVGTWHVVVLNSNCVTAAANVPSCAEQLAWLTADLAATRQNCIMAAWHHPRWSSFAGVRYNDNPDLAPWIQALYDKGADVVLAGHAHHYERLGPVDPAEVADEARGMLHFVVGTGGEGLRAAAAVRPSSKVRQWSTFGPLKLSLRARSLDWEFVRESGLAFTDTGTFQCRAKR